MGRRRSSDRLTEVAPPIQEADTQERYAQVRCRLEMIPGQHAETPRVERQFLIDAELGAQVGDGTR